MIFSRLVFPVMLFLSQSPAGFGNTNELRTLTKDKSEVLFIESETEAKAGTHPAEPFFQALAHCQPATRTLPHPFLSGEKIVTRVLNRVNGKCRYRQRMKGSLTECAFNPEQLQIIGRDGPEAVSRYMSSPSICKTL